VGYGWKDADLPTNGEEPDWDSGTIFDAGERLV
jgi:hypothetical protein